MTLTKDTPTPSNKDLEAELHKIFALCNDENCTVQCKQMMRKGMQAILSKLKSMEQEA